MHPKYNCIYLNVNKTESSTLLHDLAIILFAFMEQLSPIRGKMAHILTLTSLLVTNMVCSGNIVVVVYLSACIFNIVMNVLVRDINIKLSR